MVCFQRESLSSLGPSWFSSYFIFIFIFFKDVRRQRRDSITPPHPALFDRLLTKYLKRFFLELWDGFIKGEVT